ncbi:MAG TPA: HisA/HisF-related TIM barrel protein, partial [Bacteroidota bacterium]|nr:HisA/HisF-related TIM barrel protein [Bacteroidota bacterium]
PDRPGVAEKILARHGPAKVVAAIESMGEPDNPGTAAPGPGHPLSIGETAKRMGFRRILYTELDRTGTRHRLNPRLLARLAVSTGLRVTVSGGVVSFDDLRDIQNLQELGVDSVVLRSSLYENNFSCQKIWRLAESGGYPFTAKV